VRGNNSIGGPKDFVSKKSSGCAPNLSNDRGQPAKNINKGECCSILASKSARSSPGNPVYLGNDWKLRATREEMESERFQISQKTLVGERLGPWRRGQVPIGRQLVKRPIESGIYVFRWEWHQHSRPCKSEKDSIEKLDEIGSSK